MIHNLPNEILYIIFGYFGMKNNLMIQSVCKKFYIILNSKILWKKFYYGFSDLPINKKYNVLKDKKRIKYKNEIGSNFKKLLYLEHFEKVINSDKNNFIEGLKYDEIKDYKIAHNAMMILLKKRLNEIMELNDTREKCIDIMKSFCKIDI